MYLIIGCFHWIGFHLTKKLLDDGCRVIGIDTIESEKKENLSMFFGRNSLFEYSEVLEDMTKPRENKIKAAFHIENQRQYNNIGDTTIKPFYSLKYHHENQHSNEIKINLPLLYGEWMPRNKEGVYYNKELICFDSARFIREAVHIEDFVDALIQLLKSSKIEKRFDFSSFKHAKKSSRSDRYLVCVREQESMEKRLENLDEHYKKFKYFY